MTFDWALPQARELLPLDDGELEQIMTYASTLDDAEAALHLENLFGDSPKSIEFIASFMEHRTNSQDNRTIPEKALFSASLSDEKPAYNGNSHNAIPTTQDSDSKGPGNGSAAAPPPYTTSSEQTVASNMRHPVAHRPHTNKVIEAGKLRARDEQEMLQLLQQVQYQYRIYNSEVEPEHDTDWPCGCPIHQYQARKWRRLGVQETWARAVMYKGETFYSDSPNTFLFSRNPYQLRVISPYGRQQAWYQSQRPIPYYHAQFIHDTMSLNASLNREAQARADANEPKFNIWEEPDLSSSMEKVSISDSKNGDKRQSAVFPSSTSTKEKRTSKLARFKTAIGVSSEKKALDIATNLRDEILNEERGRWPDAEWRQIITTYQEKVGMRAKIADLRARCPIQYLHLLRAGYFEPIPVDWANQASNPLKFSIEAAGGWRGITPAWRGYEDLAEERLYWVLNHREGSTRAMMKPDFISTMNMARARMARAVEPPPLYFSADDTCRVQQTSSEYSKQVMPAPFRAYDRPEVPTDDTMILLDVSGSMGFDPVRPIYDQYLITDYMRSYQPKNKDVAKAIIRRFIDALANHDHQQDGYDLITFANHSQYVGKVNHRNYDRMWQNVHFGGGTRVMTGWQRVKELHFRKHSNSAVHHPIYGWQAGPETPMLRLLLLLDGEAVDMDEFELDLLGLSWAHVTIFLIGVDGCPHHHRHANELQRISDVNHHVSFVDAQGNCPERFVTHELLKRHLGYDITMREFERMEELPAYSEI